MKKKDLDLSKEESIKILIGYLPEKLSDFGVLSKFEALRERLIKRDYFDQKSRFKDFDMKCKINS